MQSAFRQIAIFVALAVLLAPATTSARRRRPAPQQPSGVIVYSLTTGAAIYVDGYKIGQVPMDGLIPLDAGQHTVKLLRRGYTERTEVVEISPGQRLELEMDLIPFAGLVRIDSNATESVLWLDDKPYGPLPFDGEIPIGNRHLKAVAPGHQPSEQVLEIEGGQKYELHFELLPAPMPVTTAEAGLWDSLRTKWWFWTAALTVAGGVTATVVLLTRPQPGPPPTADTVLIF